MKKAAPVTLSALATAAFLLILLGSVALAAMTVLWLALMGPGISHTDHGRDDDVALGLVFSALVGLGLGVATVVAYAIRRANAITACFVSMFRAARQRSVPEAEGRELRCHHCGTLYPSVYYFADVHAERLVCTQCARAGAR